MKPVTTWLFFSLVILACTTSELWANPTAVSSDVDASQVLARQVRGIFTAKCVECHGANVEKPKGHFGYVLDLARVAANPKMIQPGDPAKSELYLMVKYEEMPVTESSSPPLTAVEKEVVKNWIEAGAPAVVVAVADALPPLKPLTYSRRILRDIGQFHPVTTHFPIALLIVALPAELLWRRTKQVSWKTTVRFLIAGGALGAVVAASLGWCDALFMNYTRNAAQILEWHRWFGTATGVWALVTLVLSEMAHREESGERVVTWFRVTLVLGIVLVMISGYLGSSLIYGLDHYQF